MRDRVTVIVLTLLLLTACVTAPATDAEIAQRLRHAEAEHIAAATRAAELHVVEMAQARASAEATMRVQSALSWMLVLVLVGFALVLVIAVPQATRAGVDAATISWRRRAMTLTRDSAGSLPGLLIPDGERWAYADGNAAPALSVADGYVTMPDGHDVQEGHRNAKQVQAATALTRHAGGMTTSDIEQVSRRAAADWLKQVTQMPQMQAAQGIALQGGGTITVPVINSPLRSTAREDDVKLVSHTSRDGQQYEHKATRRGLLLIADMIDANEINRNSWHGPSDDYSACLDYLRTHGFVLRAGTGYAAAAGATGEAVREHVRDAIKYAAKGKS